MDTLQDANILPHFIVTWRGVAEGEVDVNLRAEILNKIRHYTRGRTVTVHVELTERVGVLHDGEDSIGAVVCGTRLFLVVITHRFTLMIDMHDVSNSIIAILMSWDQVIRVR